MNNKRKIVKIKLLAFNPQYNLNENEWIRLASKRIKEQRIKINEIIDYLNKTN